MAHTQSVALAETQDPAPADIVAGQVRIGGPSVETAVAETAVPEIAVADTTIAETTIAETMAIGSKPVGAEMTGAKGRATIETGTTGTRKIRGGKNRLVQIRKARVNEWSAAMQMRFAEAEPGDVLLMAAGAGQLHFGIRTATGFVHADAGLRRVVERPGMPPWPLIGVWRMGV